MHALLDEPFSSPSVVVMSSDRTATGHADPEVPEDTHALAEERGFFSTEDFKSFIQLSHFRCKSR